MLVLFKALATGSLLALSSSHGSQPMQDAGYPPYSVERVGSVRYKSCVARDPSNVGQGRCLEEEYKRLDARLILVAGTISRSLKRTEQQQFLKAQMAWRDFREKNCDLRAMGGGSGVALFYLGCLVRMTNERLVELEQAWDY